MGISGGWSMGMNVKKFLAFAVSILLFGSVTLSAEAQQTATPAPTPGAMGNYYNNPNGPLPPASNAGSPITPSSTILTGLVSRTDANVDFGNTEATRPAGINADRFCVTWLGTITIPTSATIPSPGNWLFRINVDDGGRLWVSKTLPFSATPNIDSWIDQGPTNHDTPT